MKVKVTREELIEHLEQMAYGIQNYEDGRGSFQRKITIHTGDMPEFIELNGEAIE